LNFLLLARGEAVASPVRARIPCGGAMLKLRRVAAFGAAHKLDGASFPASSCLQLAYPDFSKAGLGCFQ
jgi:hypothetical protein